MTDQVCQQIEPLLVDYADRELSQEQVDMVERHLASCDRCRTMTKALDRSLELTLTAWQDTRAAISLPIVRRMAGRPWRRASAAAIVGLLVMAGFVYWGVLPRSSRTWPHGAIPGAACAIRQHVENAGVAAQLLAATEQLASLREGRAIVCDSLAYIADHYPETTAAADARIRLRELCQRSD